MPSSPDRALLERLRFLLAGLREPAPSQESKRRALAAFKQLLDRKASRPALVLHLWPEDGYATVDLHVCDYRASNAGKARRLLGDWGCAPPPHSLSKKLPES